MNFESYITSLTDIFVLIVGVVLLLGLLGVGVLYVMDRSQTQHAILRNYPVIGHFRYYFEHMGEFFRQYFFAMDQEEMPFNRAQRAWCYRAAKNVDSTNAFGSTKDLRHKGTVFFVNAPFAILSEEEEKPAMVTLGPYARKPYTTNALVNISGMSFGAISKPAVQALSRGARKAGIWMNTGEGGLSPYHLEAGCDLVFQIGTAKYGVRNEHGDLSDEKLRAIAGHEQVRMFEIKISQGAKPGKGGIIPGPKITPEIAKIRSIPMGKDSISPNRHRDINSVEDLLDMIARVREVTGKPVGFKAVLGSYEWLKDLCREIGRRGLESAPDFVTIDSADGGTGAAPVALLDNVGLPVQEALPKVVDIFTRKGIRARTKIVVSGKMMTPSQVAWALCMGADFCTSARGFMFALGCIQAMQCNKNTCPTGITTHDPKMQRGLVVMDKAERVYNYATNLAHEVEVIAHSCGVTEPRKLTRHHCRLIPEDGANSQVLAHVYPYQVQEKQLQERA